MAGPPPHATDRRAAVGTSIFALIGPGLELGVGPAVLTGGWQAGEEAWPWPVRALGLGLLALGLVLVAWCLLTFAREGRGTPSPAVPARELMGGGPYRHVRHPMYLGTTLGIAGQGLLLSRPVLLLAAAVYLTAMAGLVRFREDRLLRERHGAAYDAYVRQVGGWLPRR